METKYIFRNELKAGSMEQWIRKMLEIHDLMNIDDLCRDSGCSKAAILSILDTLIQRREIERLRPLNYENDDMDFFRLRVQQRQARIETNRGRWFEGLKKAARLLFDDPEDNIEHHRLNKILTAS